MTDHLKDAKGAMLLAVDYRGQGNLLAMALQAHFATAAALIAIAEQVGRITDIMEAVADDDGGCIDVAVRR